MAVNETGQQRLALQIVPLDIRRNVQCLFQANRNNPPVIDQHRLIVARLGSCPVNQSRIRKKKHPVSPASITISANYPTGITKRANRPVDSLVSPIKHRALRLRQTSEVDTWLYIIQHMDMA